ncbi:MAG: hypothetical protein E6678_09190 [Staphylococcus epidermidis]|nr:hypothetical protein [Staphylococcus epidermidis]MDU3185957.1 hypothetical protein [Staphylococcus epidermidis]
MARSKKYFYLSLLMIILSVNIIILILSIVFADKSIKYAKESSDWIRFASKILPLIILITIIIHILSSLHTFGYIFK